MREFLLCLPPVAVAVNPANLLPVFVSLTEGLGEREIRRTAIQSVITALLVAGLFLLVGRWILEFLGIRDVDVLIAGGGLVVPPRHAGHYGQAAGARPE